MRTIANLQEILDLANRGAIFYIGHSGGKDSQAMYSIITQYVPSSQIRVVHADLGDIEWPGVKEHITSNTWHPTIIAQARKLDGSDNDLFSMIRNRRIALDAKGKTDAPAFPSSAARFCTSDLKTGPIWREIRNDGDHKIVVNCVGIRGQESKSRAKKIEQRGTLNLNAKNTNSKREAYDWWPIANWSIGEVWREISDAGQMPHSAYANGNDRLSCMFCIFGSRNDLMHAKQENLKLYQRYVELETEVRGTMFNGESLAERIGE